jgi:hypothetical protein
VAAGAPDRVALFHGPDRTPLGWPPAGPFHGVVSRGLLPALAAHGPARWAAWAPWLDQALAGETRAAAVVPAEVVDAARDAGVLTFADSATAACRYLARHLGDALVGLGADGQHADPALVELWSVKEGHTASVWRATVRWRGAVAARFAVNVARDRAAAGELRASAAELTGLAARCGALVAEPLHVAAVEVPGHGHVAILAQRWIDGALEVGSFRPRGASAHRLHAVERFLTSPGAPATIAGIRGRRLTDAEHVLVIGAAIRAGLAGVETLPDGRTSVPRTDVARGDLVLAGAAAHVVATAGERDVVAAGDVVGHLARAWHAAGLRDDHGRRLVDDACARAAGAGVPPR